MPNGTREAGYTAACRRDGTVVRAPRRAATADATPVGLRLFRSCSCGCCAVSAVACRAGLSLGFDGCEVRLCDPCARVRPCVPCVSRVCPGSPRYLFTGRKLSV